MKMRWVGLCAVVLFMSVRAHAGSIILMGAGAEDLMTNSLCTGSSAPAPCCTGAGTGTCGDINGVCRSSTVPLSCCTGSGTGTCGTLVNAPLAQYTVSLHRPLGRDFVFNASNAVCTSWHFQVPQDFPTGGLVAWRANMMEKATVSGGSFGNYNVDIACVASGESLAISTNKFYGGDSVTHSDTGALYSLENLGHATLASVINPECSARDEAIVRFCRQFNTGTPGRDLSLMSLQLVY